MRENEVTVLYVMEVKTDVANQMKMMSRSPCSDLLQNNSLQFSIASKANCVRIDNLAIQPKDVDGMANSVDPDQTAPSGAV